MCMGKIIGLHSRQCSAKIGHTSRTRMYALFLPLDPLPPVLPPPTQEPPLQKVRVEFNY